MFIYHCSCSGDADRLTFENLKQLLDKFECLSKENEKIARQISQQIKSGKHSQLHLKRETNKKWFVVCRPYIMAYTFSIITANNYQGTMVSVLPCFSLAMEAITLRLSINRD